MNQNRNFHIISWNVAGWSTTLERIIQQNGSLKIFLSKHNVDILLIQEVKMPSTKICDQSRDVGATGDHDFDFFCACPINHSERSSKKGQGSGLNGVATFARKGITQSASSSILEYPELNNEGRCLFTDHGSFVIFNLYVPNSGDQHKRYIFKMKFLRALQKAVSKQRLLGKKIIVLGDLNIAPRSVDVCRSYRRVLITDILNASFLQGSQCLFCPTLNRNLNNHEIGAA